MPLAQRKTQASSDPVEIFLYGIIGDSWWWEEEPITGKSIAAKLAKIAKGTPIKLRVNSEGGAVGEALAIYNLLAERREDVTAYIDGYALSAASYIPLAAGLVISPKASIWMVHNPWSIALGSAEDLRREAAALDTHRDAILSIYADRTGQTTEQIIEWLDAETWFTGEEAVEYGFADESVDEPIEVDQTLPQQFKAMATATSVEEKLQALGWSWASGERKSQSRVIKGRVLPAATAPPLELEPETLIQIQESTMSTNQKTEQIQDNSERLTQMSDQIRDLKLQLSTEQKSAAEAKSESARLNTVVQYWQLRAQAVSLWAIENKLTEEEYNLDFSEDPAVDIERLTSMDADDSRIELKTVDRALRRAALKSPGERLKEPADAAKTENTTLKSTKADGNPGERKTATGASATETSPTGESAKDYAARIVKSVLQ
jgi:ATP-dependent protease ClpP protease subunit